MINQGAFTAITPIEPKKLEELRKYLKGVGDTVDAKGCGIQFREFKTVHFMRWIILDPATDLKGEYLEPCLVLSTNFDLPLERHLRELVDKGGAAIRTIYNSCRGFDASTELQTYLLKHEVPYAAFYVGTRGRDVQMIHDEQYLREEIQKFLDKSSFAAGKSKREIRDAIQGFVQGRPDLQWALRSDSVESWQRFFLGGKKIVNAVLAVVAILLVGAIVGSAFVGPAWFGLPWWQLPVIEIGILIGIFLVLPQLIFRVIEARERARPLTSKPVGATLDKLLSREDQIVQNQLSNVVLIKPGFFRPLILRLVLGIIDFAGRIYFTRGALGGIPTIHFARWIIFDRGRRLLFFSNFDGSWENYLGDFVDKASTGLTAIWSNTVGCPPAHLLYKGGARDEAAFKSWVRENQLFTDVWYSAYEELSVQNINNNSYIRLWLNGDIDDDKLTEWLERF